MRVRWEIFKNGKPTGTQVECDMTERKARSLYNKLKEDGCCGWGELVAEEDEEGGYMEIIDSFDHWQLAKAASEFIAMFG